MRTEQSVCCCSVCREGIYEGEEYVVFDKEIYCMDCLWDMPVRELVERLGGVTLTAVWT